MVIHLPFLPIVFPSNVMFLYEALMPIVGFDFLDAFIEWRE